MYRFRLLIINGVLLLALAGAVWGRAVEGAVLKKADFLAGIDLPFKGWKTEDTPLKPNEIEMLQPDSSLIRRYFAPDKEWVELAVIAGHKKRSVHNPGFCMVGGGWEMTSQSEWTLNTPDGPIPAIRTVLLKDGYRLLVSYFFTDGTKSTSSATQFAISQLMRRFTTPVPVGALVRLSAPIGTDEAHADARLQEFAAAVAPPVLASVKQVQTQVR